MLCAVIVGAVEKVGDGNYELSAAVAVHVGEGWRAHDVCVDGDRVTEHVAASACKLIVAPAAVICSSSAVLQAESDCWAGQCQCRQCCNEDMER